MAGEQNGSGPIVQVRDLVRIYRLGASEVQALRGVNLMVGSGSFVALRGRSGRGKTALVNCIGGLD
ncbi:MAG: ABC transporter ATP-binding protein, partial [Anaerolineae bacterium]|nr:ABC transporter ATP-binding protein [Anaerolineae bacterium]